MYSFKTDMRNGVIEIVMSGFLMPGDVDRFRADLAEEAATVRATGRAQATLYDYTEAAIQSQETVAALGRMARDNPLRARKTAIFTAGRLARRQACRIVDGVDHIRMFEDRAAALEWLRA